MAGFTVLQEYDTNVGHSDTSSAVLAAMMKLYSVGF